MTKLSPSLLQEASKVDPIMCVKSLYLNPPDGMIHGGNTFMCGAHQEGIKGEEEKEAKEG